MPNLESTQLHSRHENQQSLPTGSNRGTKRLRNGKTKKVEIDGPAHTAHSNGSKSTAPLNEPPLGEQRSENGVSDKTKSHTVRRSKPQSHKEHGNTRALFIEKRAALLKTRQALPIWNHSGAIKKALSGTKDVLLMVGETGSGKSTQVPQFLVEEPWCKSCIAITQPRRVAAISLARRVAEEMGQTLGSPGSKVGYSVRFDQSFSHNTRIKFLTEGMLLQEMLRDPMLPQYSAVIVDEVHERSVNVDLIMGFLRNLVSEQKRKKPMKVVVMSATADVKSLFDFFKVGINTSTSSTSTPQLSNGAVASAEDEGSEKSWSGISEDAGVAPPEKKQIQTAIEQDLESLQTERISTCFIKGRQFEVKTVYLSNATTDFVESALKTIFQIHCKEPLPGDVLVFLTGQDTVEALQRLVNEYAGGLDHTLPKILTLPLFAALPQSAQQRVFDPAPYMTRKIILATNIAETSITVPGIRYVVDCGKVKIKQFRNRLGLDSLLVKPISISSAIQRQGRAGREAPGQCHRLYTEKDFQQLQLATTPEILRCDLSEALLTMKARGIDDVINFPFLDPPPRDSLEKALLQLLQLNALQPDGRISTTGTQIARLPLGPTLGRVLIEASQLSRACLPEIIDIIACLSVENIFLNLLTEEKKEAATEARKELYRREGDHLTLLATVRAYAAEHADRKAWSEQHFVSHRAMQNVMDVRKQLRQQCTQMKLLPKALSSSSLDDNTEALSAPSEEAKTAILQCLLRGFAANTARLTPDGSYKTMLGNQTVAIHPASTLFGRKVEGIVFSEFVFTNRSYARGVSAVRLDWIGEVLAGES